MPLIRALLLAGAGLCAALLSALALRWLRPLTLPLHQPPARRQLGRRIPFDGPGNLRDLGGYASADGRTVRWGVLYRSDHLGKLSARDIRHFRRLGLVTLIDFRSVAERSGAPNRLPSGHSIRVVELPVFDDETSNAMGVDLRARIERGELAGIDPATLLTEANQRMVTAFTPVFRQFFREILAAEGAPVLFHCTAGKDRTGFAAAVLLRILGIPQEAIVADYLRSRDYSLALRRRELILLRLLKGRALTELVRTLLGVEAAYLHAAFDTIERDYGSFESYVRDGLGLSDADVARLRQNLLHAML